MQTPCNSPCRSPPTSTNGLAPNQAGEDHAGFWQDQVAWMGWLLWQMRHHHHHRPSTTTTTTTNHTTQTPNNEVLISPVVPSTTHSVGSFGPARLPPLTVPPPATVYRRI